MKQNAKLVNTNTDNITEEAVATEFEVVRDVSTTVAKRGRPRFLTTARFESICKLVEEGATNVAACRQMLVSYPRFRAVVNDNSKYQDRLKEATKIREEVWRDHALEMVRNAMPKSWIAAMTYLERRFPSEFSLKTVVRSEGDTAKASYQLLTKEQLVALVEAEKAALAETPRGFDSNEQSEVNANEKAESID
jgi:hypothetical protein